MGRGMNPSQVAAAVSLMMPRAFVTHLDWGAQVWMPNGYGVSLITDPRSLVSPDATGDKVEAAPARILTYGDGGESVERWAVEAEGPMPAGARLRPDVSPEDVCVMLTHLGALPGREATVIGVSRG